MGVYIDSFAVWESNLVGAPWYSAPFKLAVMLVLLAVVLAVVSIEVEFAVDLRLELSERDPEVG